MRSSPVSRALSALLIVGVLGGSSGFHFGDDDLLCALERVHDASAHRIQKSSGRPTSAPNHCFLCHWQRSFRALVALADIEQGIGHACAVDAETASLHVRVFDRSVPARAPPA
jgi:hypothetical protein